MHRILALGAAAAASLALAAPAAAQDTTKGGAACTLDGEATFATGLTTTSQRFEYAFHGTLTNCTSDRQDAPAVGKVSTGGQREIDGVAYRLPLAQGEGSCASSTTKGVSIIDWGPGRTTVLQYETVGFGALVALRGTVVPEIQLTSVDGQRQAKVVSTMFPNGSTSVGSLVFGADGQQCATATGVTKATITGATGIGKYT